jgi:DNA repair exonuclease SbcCD ATPase subunit
MSEEENRQLTLIKLNNDLNMLEFELSILNSSIHHYASKKYYQWDCGHKREQLEEIRRRIPEIYEHMNEVKQTIRNLGGKIKKDNYDIYEDEYDEDEYYEYYTYNPATGEYE